MIETRKAVPSKAGCGRREIGTGPLGLRFQVGLAFPAQTVVAAKVGQALLARQRTAPYSGSPWCALGSVDGPCLPHPLCLRDPHSYIDHAKLWSSCLLMSFNLTRSRAYAMIPLLAEERMTALLS